jgi:hypothetical protein
MLHLQLIGDDAENDGCYRSPCRRIQSLFRGLGHVRGHGGGRESMVGQPPVADWRDRVHRPILHSGAPVCSSFEEASWVFCHSNSVPPFVLLESRTRVTLSVRTLAEVMSLSMVADCQHSESASCDDHSRSM